MGSRWILAITSCLIIFFGYRIGFAAEEPEIYGQFEKVGPIIRDTVTGLEWQVGPERDMHWAEARDWVDSLGNGWRMPSIEELEGLYEAGVSADSRGPFACNGDKVWADSPASWDFSDGGGIGYPTGMEPSVGHRVFAVRDPS